MYPRPIKICERQCEEIEQNLKKRKFLLIRRKGRRIEIEIESFEINTEASGIGNGISHNGLSNRVEFLIKLFKVTVICKMCEFFRMDCPIASGCFYIAIFIERKKAHERSVSTTQPPNLLTTIEGGQGCFVDIR